MIEIDPTSMQPSVRIANYIGTRRGTGWLDRVIPDFELIYVAGGRLEYVGESRLDVQDGQVLLIFPNERHDLRVRAGGTISCLHGELLKGYSWAAHDYQFNPWPKQLTEPLRPERVHDLFHRCAEAFMDYGPYSQALAEAVARQIWIVLAGQWAQTGEQAISKRLSQMVEYLRDHLTESVSRRDLAAAFHLTPEHVNYLFRRELGTSPTQFVLRERVLLAYELIQAEGLSVKEAAARVGFNDPFYFSRIFKRIAGISPSKV